MHEGKEATERAGGGLEVPGGGVQPYQGGLAHHTRKTGRCVMLSSCHTIVHVLISLISGEVLFHHSWRSSSATTAGQICVPSQLPGRQDFSKSTLFDTTYTTSNTYCSLFQMDYVMANNVYMK